jgi:hypothetical protein
VWSAIGIIRVFVIVIIVVADVARIVVVKVLLLEILNQWAVVVVVENQVPIIVIVHAIGFTVFVGVEEVFVGIAVAVVVEAVTFFVHRGL